jgi:hypothetical protein
MNFRSLLFYAWIMVFLIAPTKGAVISGIVFDDADASGKQDDPNNEPGIPSVSIVIIDINKVRQTVMTDQNGFYQADVPPGRVKVDVDDSTLPPGYLQTAGMDPLRHSVPVLVLMAIAGQIQVRPNAVPTKRKRSESVIFSTTVEIK